MTEAVHWRALLSAIDGWAERAERARRQFADNGVTYNIHADPRAADRPYRFDVVPLVLGAGEWSAIEAGLIQRATLIETILADAYGEQRLVKEGAYPADLLFANPQFLRPLRNAAIPGQRHIGLYAADLIRTPEGKWQVTADRLDSPAGLGFALENRRVLSRVLPEGFRAVAVRSLRNFFDLWQASLAAAAPLSPADPRIVLLTRGSESENYFEHIYLARELGVALVESADLTARGGRIHLKTLGGLQPVDVILRRVSGALCDPLELEATPSGIAGLVDAIRAGSVAVVNSLGAGLAETPGLVSYFDRQLALSSASVFNPSMAPSWTEDGLQSRPVVLRTFTIAHEGGFVVLPGGLSYVPGDGLAKDVWVLTADRGAMAVSGTPKIPASDVRRTSGELPSRIAENLYWFGRYSERLDFSGRTLRAGLTNANTPFGDLAVLPSLLDLFGRIENLAFPIRDRFSGDMWATLNRLLHETRKRLTKAAGDPDQLLAALDDLLHDGSAVGGMASENMTRGMGWHFLDLGRKIERAIQTLHAIDTVLGQQGIASDAVLFLVLDLCDSTITYRTRYLSALQTSRVLDLVLADDTNPRAVAFQLADIVRHLRAMPNVDELSPDLALTEEALAALRRLDYSRLRSVLDDVSRKLQSASDALVRRHFTLVSTSQIYVYGQG